MKAMILAAGRGERLRPLTDHTPKPIIPVGNTTLIDHLLSQLARAGIIDVVINVHHLAEKMIAHCGDGSQHGMRIQYSVEENLLDTGGGILRALSLLGDEPFLVISADIWTDFPLHTLLQKKCIGAHLVMVNNPAFHASGDFGLKDDRIILKTAENSFTYGNIALVHPKLFSNIRQSVFPLSIIFKQAIENNIAMGEHYDGYWVNVGTAEILDALRDVEE